MPLTQESRLRLRVWSIGISYSVDAAIAIIGAHVHAQGGNFWPWAFLFFAITTAGLIYAAIASKRYAQTESYIREQERKKRRKQQRLTSR